MEKKTDNLNIKEDEKKLKKELEIISDLLTNICEESSKDRDTNGLFMKFFLSKKIPSISIQNFLERLTKYSKMENNTLILILIYIDRFCDINKVRLNYFNIHKLIIASLIVSIKYNEDYYYSNKIYAKICGISREEINKLEIEFLKLLEFNLFVDDEIYFQYSDFILNEE
jgi:Fe-S cluster assembly ATPase SufC